MRLAPREVEARPDDSDDTDDLMARMRGGFGRERGGPPAPVERTCSQCYGSGVEMFDPSEPCEVCRGTGDDGTLLHGCGTVVVGGWCRGCDREVPDGVEAVLLHEAAKQAAREDDERAVEGEREAWAFEAAQRGAA